MASTNKKPIYYLPIADPDLILSGCETLLRSLITRIIERQINGYSTYTNEYNVKRIKITKLVIEFVD